MVGFVSCLVVVWVKLMVGLVISVRVRVRFSRLIMVISLCVVDCGLLIVGGVIVGVNKGFVFFVLKNSWLLVCVRVIRLVSVVSRMMN